MTEKVVNSRESVSPAVPAYVSLSGMTPDDVAFVKSTWVNSYRFAEGCVELDGGVYFPWMRARIAQILTREPLIIVARDREDPATLYAYGVFERVGAAFCCHWLYTRKHAKKRGIARLILAAGLQALGAGASELVTTHRTYMEPTAIRYGFAFRKLSELYGTGREAA